MNILTHSTSTALWYEVVQIAEATCAISLQKEMEAYLVFLLMRYINKPVFTHQIMGLEFLNAMSLSLAQRAQALQEVGDKCLLLTGLYPALAHKRLVRLSYFVKLGQAAYSRISEKDNDLYELLDRHFVVLMDVLQATRQYTQQYPDLLPLQAYELWNDTGSQRALSILRQYTSSVPILIDINRR